MKHFPDLIHAAALTRGLQQLALVLDEDCQHKLLAYLALLEKWNAAFNLTAVREPRDMVPKHLLDSLAVLPYLHGQRILDVGTGAGLPGIPLALAASDCHFTLLDSNGKKTRFVTQAVLSLGVRNVTVVKARVGEYREAASFDSIVSRAFASLADFVAGSAHLLAPNGRWLAMKGVWPEPDARPLPAGMRLRDAHAIRVPDLAAARHVIEVDRTPPD